MEDCVFCQIISGERPADFIYQGDTVVAFKDRRPMAPIHLLVVPRKHIRSLNDLKEEDYPLLSDLLIKARDIARDLRIHHSGYKLGMNVERGGGQVIFHVHLHLAGGW